MIEVFEYKPEHYEAIKDAVEPFSVPKDCVGVKDRGIAITGTDGDAMACGGIMYVEDGGVVWLKVSKSCSKNAYAWGRSIKEVFALMLESVDVPVYTYILDGFCQGARLAKSIGLKKTDEVQEHNGNRYYKYAVK
jgi:hypothetical protein